MVVGMLMSPGTIRQWSGETPVLDGLACSHSNLWKCRCCSQYIHLSHWNVAISNLVQKKNNVKCFFGHLIHNECGYISV